MAQDRDSTDLYTFLRHQLPPVFPPTISPRLSYAIDVQHFHERNTSMVFYLWLHDYREFWFFPTNFTVVYVQGYYWDGEKWIGSNVERARIFAFF